jgi:hypothetical protein
MRIRDKVNLTQQSNNKIMVVTITNNSVLVIVTKLFFINIVYN